MSGLDKEFALYDFVPSSELLIFGVFLFEFYIELELQRLQSKRETKWSFPKGRLELKKILSLSFLSLTLLLVSFSMIL